MSKLVVEGFGRLTASNLNSHPDRVAKFLDKVNSGDSFELHPDYRKVVVDPNCDGAEALRRYPGESLPRNLKFSVKYEDGTVDDVPAGNFVKTQEFGGGGGVAGGSYQTKYFEAGQCVMNSLRQVCSDLSISKENQRNLKNLNCRLGKDLTVDKVWNFLMKVQDIGWVETLQQTADFLYGKTGGKGYWHWQDDFVKSISKVYSQFADKLPGTLDRWNPADIWYTLEDVTSIESLLKVDSLLSCADFTDAMDSLYNKGLAVGISLKKKEGESIQGKKRYPKEAVIKVSDIQVEEIRNNSCTLNIKFTEDGKHHVLQIRAGSEYKLRVHTSKASGGTHFDGGCTQPVLDYCLKTCLGLPQDQLDQCNPEYYKSKFKNLEECFVLDHQSEFDDETIMEAEERLEGHYPLYQEYPEGLVNESEGTVSAKRAAARAALDVIYKALINAPSSKLTDFVTLLTKYCWSLVPESARHYKVY